MPNLAALWVMTGASVASVCWVACSSLPRLRAATVVWRKS